MSLSKPKVQSSFFDAEFLVDHLFGPDSPYRLFRVKILPLLEKARPALEGMYCATNGRPAIDPVRMAGVTLLEFMEHLPDRQAAQRLRESLGWKFALRLDVGDEGFDPSSLVNFRGRLLKNDQARLAFDRVREGLEAEGLIERQSRMRLDSTHLLANISRMSRLDKVRETLRLALKAISKDPAHAGWAEWEALWAEYGHEHGPERDQTPAQGHQKLMEAAEAMSRVIAWLAAQPKELRDAKPAALLRRVFAEQFEVVDGKVAKRAQEEAGGVHNPHDPDAEWSAKDPERKTAWVGGKVQVLETVKDEAARPKGAPTENFIVDIVTTAATVSDLAGMEQVLESQKAQGRPVPQELLVDAAYVSAGTLAQAKTEGRELLGPPLGCPPKEGVLSAEQFEVDLEARTAICPAGHASTKCGHIHDAHQNAEYYRFHWGRQCASCERRSGCTKSRERTVCVGVHHDALQERRQQMEDPEFVKRLRARNGIEGTISELARGGMRRARYRGRPRWALADWMHGAACNVKRWLRLAAWRMKQAHVAAATA